MFAFLVMHVPNQISKQARQNIDLCFAELDPVARRNLLRESIRHTCYAITELGAVWSWPLERIFERITTVDICEEFSASEHGRIILVPHLGSWEMFAIWMGQNCDAIFLYKRPRNRELDAFSRAARARSGGTPVPAKRRGLRKLLIGLRQGASIMILPDQKPGPNKTRIDSTFFGYDAPTTALVHTLSSKPNCKVFLGTMLRSDPPGEFSLKIRPLEHARLAADEVASAQYMNDQIEAVVRTCPGQYQWSYRRFASSAYALINRDSR